MPTAPDAVRPPAQEGADPTRRRPDLGGKRPVLSPAMAALAGAPGPVVVERRALAFDAPFGEGASRHTGVRAASAILPYQGGWLIAQDDSNFAAHWTHQGIAPLRLFAPAADGSDVFSTAQGNKAEKPDLEAGAVVGGRPVFFGSGSTSKRTRAAVVGASGPRVADLASLYDAARAVLGLAPDALNLEAACATGDRVRFFQRGNGAGAVNATFEVAERRLLDALEGRAPIGAEDLAQVRRHDLGALGDAPLGFSAAASLDDGTVIFAASAEASPSTYDDGPCAGSVLGVMSPDGEIRALWPLAGDPVKIEGLAIARTTGRRVELIAVTDADDPSRPSEALRLELSLP